MAIDPDEPTITAGRSLAGRRLLRDAIRDNRGPLSAAASLLSLHQLCEVAVPVVIGLIVDRAVRSTDVSVLTGLLAILAAVFTVLTIAYRFGARIAMRIAQEQAHRFRIACVRVVLTSPRLTADESASSDAAAADAAGDRPRSASHGEILSTANSDADAAGLIMRFLPQAVAALVALLGCAVTLLSVDVTLGLIVVVGVPLVLSVVQVVAPFVTRLVGAQQAHIARATGLATDLITGLRPLRGIGGTSAALERYREVNEQARRAMRRAALGHGMFFGTATGVTGILAVAVAILTGWFALTGRISIGELIAVLGVAQFLTEPLALLSMFPGRFAEASASATRLAQVAQAHDEFTGELTPTVGPPDIRTSASATKPVDDDRLAIGFRAVTDTLLEDLDVAVRPGECVVLNIADQRVADRVIALLNGARRPRAGEVTIIGQPAADLPSAARPATLLVEPHAVDLFGGTVWTNLAVAADLDRRRAIEVLDILGSADIVGAQQVSASDEQILDLEVADRGHSLSGGQRQRLALARALLTDPDILVLHDPTTAVDSLTEQTIADAVHCLRHLDRSDRTTLIISGSPAWSAAVDRVITIDGESVHETGSVR